jgi:hypothetical protein
MTVDELIKLGNNKPVMYRGVVVTFECLSMRFAYWTTRKQPMKASIKCPWGQVMLVFPKQLSPVQSDAIAR